MAGTKDIKNFTKYPSLSDNDYLLGTKTDLGGTDAGITVADFKKLVAQDVKPTIKNGYWWVNGVNTGELATGRTPQFRYTVNGLEMKYDNEDDAAYRLIIPIEDLLFTFDDLTPEQVELLKLKFSDLTEADKEELRGKAFTYDDFTSEQLADLRMTWDKLTPAQKKELQGERGYSAYEVWEQQDGNTGKTVDDYLAWLRQPATSAGEMIREEMDRISEEADEVIRDTNAVKEDAEKAADRANRAAELAEGVVAGVVPTKLSELDNDTGFVTNTVENLTNYYLKSETYTRDEVLSLISQIKGVSFLPVETLPDAGETNIIYLLPKEGTADDVYNEYIWIESTDKYEPIGSTSVDLSNYYTKEEVNTRYVLKETGKRLMTDEEGTKLDGIEEGANKFEYPSGAESGQVLTWGESSAVWGTPAGGNFLEIGDVSQIGKSLASTSLYWPKWIGGLTPEDFDKAIADNIPIYSRKESAYYSNKQGYIPCTSITKYVDGSVIHYYMTFLLGYGVGDGKGITSILIDLSHITTGWRSALARGTQIGGAYYNTGGDTSIPFTGGFIYHLVASQSSKDLVLSNSYYYPLQNSTTTILCRNDTSGAITPSITLSDEAKADGSKLLILNDFPTLEKDQGCEINILWADWRYMVRISEPFDFNYV